MSHVFNIPIRATKGNFFAFRLLPHDDLKQSILSFASANHIKAGAVVACVGSLEQVNIRFANQQNGDTRREFFEIVSLTGTFSETSAHLHLCVSDKNGSTIGGHLLDNNLVYTTTEIVIVELTELEFVRETDVTYGFQELVVKKRSNVD